MELALLRSLGPKRAARPTDSMWPTDAVVLADGADALPSDSSEPRPMGMVPFESAAQAPKRKHEQRSWEAAKHARAEKRRLKDERQIAKLEQKVASAETALGWALAIPGVATTAGVDRVTINWPPHPATSRASAPKNH